MIHSMLMYKLLLDDHMTQSVHIEASHYEVDSISGGK